MKQLYTVDLSFGFWFRPVHRFYKSIDRLHSYISICFRNPKTQTVFGFINKKVDCIIYSIFLIGEWLIDSQFRHMCQNRL